MSAHRYTYTGDARDIIEDLKSLNEQADGIAEDISEMMSEQKERMDGIPKSQLETDENSEELSKAETYQESLDTLEDITASIACIIDSLKETI